MTENEKLVASIEGVLLMVEELVEALTASNPGLSVALEERVKVKINKLAEADDEEGFYKAMALQVVLKKIQSNNRLRSSKSR
ncbi:hypothetical protein [Muricoccus nepalensis]|uniref:hypothetical protein n=1 Tax=Muricoccus nepalensis TaxID=1854500 RepID=UPI00112662A5|nr:hypothetical protein [Roseomonas nepalensis]